MRGGLLDEIVTKTHLLSARVFWDFNASMMTRLLFLLATSACFTLPAVAQFNPGPSPVAGTVGAQTLTTGTGTVSASGLVSTAGSNVAVTISGSSTLNNSGTIIQTGSGRAIDNTVNNSTLTINNTGWISSVSTDAIRVNTGSSSVSLTNSGTISVSAGGQALDFAAITTGSNSVVNQAGGVINAVGEDAVRPGRNGSVNNAGLISATPTVTSGTASGSDGVDLRILTGISVTNTGTISGRHGIATDGANVGPSILTVNNNAGTIVALNGSGINVDGANTTVTANVTNAMGATINGGVLSNTTNGDGDGVDVDGVLTLNNSGDILGLGAKGVGSDGNPNNAEGVAAGGGSITNTATGRIIGSTLVSDAPNGDPTRAGNGILVDNSSGGNAVAVTTIVNSGLIQGKTGFAIRLSGTSVNFADSITNNATGTIRGSGTTAAIQTGDGADTVTNRGAIVSDNGNAIDLEAGNDTLVIEGASASVTGNVSGGAGSNSLTLNPGSGNSFAYSGTISNFSTVTVASGSVALSGANTYTGATLVTGGELQLTGGGMLGSGDVTVAAGASLDISGISASTYTLLASQTLTVGGTIDATGKTLIASGTVNPGASPGLMTVDGAFFLLDGANLQMEVDGLGRGTTYDALDVTGLFTLAGGITVTSTYVFALNDSLDLLNFGSIDASGFLPAELSLPGLGSGLFWDSSSLTTSGVITVVPEPSSLALLAAAGSLFVFYRRRNR